jgi:hypothetical protein
MSCQYHIGRPLAAASSHPSVQQRPSCGTRHATDIAHPMSLARDTTFVSHLAGSGSDGLMRGRRGLPTRRRRRQQSPSELPKMPENGRVPIVKVSTFRKIWAVQVGLSHNVRSDVECFHRAARATLRIPGRGADDVVGATACRQTRVSPAMNERVGGSP